MAPVGRVDDEGMDWVLRHAAGGRSRRAGEENRTLMRAAPS
jgi:hypothetical protein